MKLAVDTYYYSDNLALTVGVLFNRWTDDEPAEIISSICTSFSSYIPGEFYKRELPCVLGLLVEKVDLDKVETIIVDGFLRLRFNDGTEKDGLGKKLFDELNMPGLKIIGLAKSEFCRTSEISASILRGSAEKPLWVQGIGLPDNVAAGNIKMMSGEFRIPKLLKILDKETKKYR
jgi:deoxyinosine 3'endonuclease (endonuclease V)